MSGMTRPEAVVCSASTALTTMRSSSGLMETDTVTFLCMGPTGGPRPVRSWCGHHSLRARSPSRGSAERAGTCVPRVLRTNLGTSLALGQAECQDGRQSSGSSGRRACSRRW
ncbi:hypothetical protein [Ornithinimicrobium kibberense]|uniref:hypothetical protein n=1 Tax=Ornithinimicrobium kibberense TaxID=282060 RepID=UPI003611FC49